MKKIIDSSIREVTFGKNVRVIKPVNLYECHLEDNVSIGPFVEIQSGVGIGKNSKVQSHSFICELVQIMENVFIGHGVMFINDSFRDGGPAQGDKSKWNKTKIGNNVSIGSNSTILPVNICDDVVIGAGSVVTKSIEVPGTYAGNPAKLIRKF